MNNNNDNGLNNENNYIKLVMTDPEENTNYEIYVTAENYERAIRNPVYAQELFEAAKTDRSNSNNNDMNQTENEDNTAINNSENEHSVEDGTDKHVWTYEEALCLINSMQNHLDDLNHPRRRKQVFSNIANDLLSNGFSVSVTACSNKWKNLLRSYKTTKDSKNKTGKGPTRFLFYEQMDAILGEKPVNKCVHTIESTENENENQNVVDENNTNNEPSVSTSTNTKNSEVSKTHNAKYQFLKMKKEEYENQRQKT